MHVKNKKDRNIRYMGFSVHVLRCHSNPNFKRLHITEYGIAKKYIHFQNNRKKEAHDQINTSHDIYVAKTNSDLDLNTILAVNCLNN